MLWDTGHITEEYKGFLFLYMYTQKCNACTLHITWRIFSSLITGLRILEGFLQLNWMANSG